MHYLSSKSFSVLLGDGTGRFGAAVSTTVTATVDDLALGDWDKDGKLDVAAAQSSVQQISVLLGDGKGGFTLLRNHSTSAATSRLASGDWDGDGKSELAAPNALKTGIIVWSNWSPGPGVGVKLYELGGAVGSILSTDVNGDGKHDLVVWMTDLRQTKILLNDGSGIFNEKLQAAPLTCTGKAMSVDVNGDSKVDLVMGGSRFCVVLGDGTGRFYATTGSFLSGQGTYDLASLDFNKDGKPDLISANPRSKDLSILINQTS